MKIGRRLAIKLLNAVEVRPRPRRRRPPTPPVTEPLDLADARRAGRPGRRRHPAPSTASTTPGPSSAPRTFFWRFCDDYLELVKGRAYGDGRRRRPPSARVALRIALSTLLRLFAPFLPFVTEEVWSWCAPTTAAPGFTPRSTGPVARRRELRALVRRRPGRRHPSSSPSPPTSSARIRKAKSDAKVSMRAEVDTVTVTDTPDRLAALGLAAGDVRDAGKVADLATQALADGARALGRRRPGAGRRRSPEPETRPPVKPGPSGPLRAGLARPPAPEPPRARPTRTGPRSSPATSGPCAAGLSHLPRPGHRLHRAHRRLPGRARLLLRPGCRHCPWEPASPT